MSQSRKAGYKPEGFHSATPYLTVESVAKAVDFYKQAFGAVEREPRHEDGDHVHAEIKIGDSMFMLGQHKNIDPRLPENLPRLSIYLYVENCDATLKQGVAAGAREMYPATDQFYGNREGGMEDPFGIVWWIATRSESLTPA